MNRTREEIAIGVVTRKGPILAEKHPEIADRYRAGKTQRQIARRFPSEFRKSPKVAEGIVFTALRILIINTTERKRLQRQHSLNRRKNYAEGVSLPPNLLTAEGRKANADRLTIARGQQPIPDREKRLIASLLTKRKYKHESGPNAGHNNIPKIREALRQKLGRDISYNAIKLEIFLHNRGKTRQEYQRQLTRRKRR